MIKPVENGPYAKKKAARIAKEEAERAEILAGTSFEKVSLNTPSDDSKIAV